MKLAIILIVAALVLAVLAGVFWLTWWAWTLVGFSSSKALGASILMWIAMSGFSFTKKGSK